MPFDPSKINFGNIQPSGPIRSAFEAPIPGEALTNKPKAFPHERPPRYTELDDAFHHIFMRITQPQVAKQLLALLEAGIGVDTLVEMLSKSGAEQGLWSIPMSFLIAAPLTVAVVRMAQVAKVDFIMSQANQKPEKIPQILLKLSEARVTRQQAEDAAKAAQKSEKDIVKDHLNMGLLSPQGFI